MHVQVTFKIDASDPDDHTGLAEDDYIGVIDGVGQIGGYDVEIEKVEA